MAEAGKLLRGLLEVFILESLEKEPKHGYALLKEMGEVFGQQPNRNRLYPLLAKLVAEGYIREVSESGGNRTLYALTQQGLDALHSYRRLPPAFRHALRRIWGHEGAPDAPAGAEDVEEARAAQALAHAGAPTRVSVRVLDAEEDAPAAPHPADDLPYPCPDARLDVAKEARSGVLTLRLTGCPMGAYAYCPECPVSKAVEGMRRLVF